MLRLHLADLLGRLQARDAASMRLTAVDNPRTRLAIAAAIGGLAGILAWALIARPGYPSDFYHYWTASRALLSGGDPYAPVAASAMNPGADPALYPLPALVMLAPVALLPLGIAGGIFMGASSGLAAWGIARTGAERLPLFLSAPFVLALSLGQWSPLIVAAFLIPVLAGLLIAKPNIGLAAFVARPSLHAVVGGLVILGLSFAFMPDWVPRWLGNISGREEKFIPLLQPGGFLIALAALSWRRPEGRLLLALGAVPQALFFYDQLVLWLVPRTLRQSMMMSLWSFGALLLWRAGLEEGDYYVQEAIPFAYSLYFIALAILLWNWYRARRSQGAKA